MIQNFQRDNTIKIVDTREPIEIREALMKVGWIQKPLLSGDFFFMSHDFKKIGIERKSVDDLVASINGTKLNEQLENCFDFYDTVILIIEGSWSTITENDNIVTSRGIQRSTWCSIWNYLHQFKRKGMLDEITVNQGHTIERVNELYVLYQKMYSSSARSKNVADERVLAFPSGGRGNTAIEGLKLFKSINLACRADINDLRNIPNVGLKKATSIYNHFHKGEEGIITEQEKEDPVATEEDLVKQGNLLE